MKSALMWMFIISDLRDLAYLTSICFLPFPFSASGIQLSPEGPPLSHLVPNVGMRTLSPTPRLTPLTQAWYISDFSPPGLGIIWE